MTSSFRPLLITGCYRSGTTLLEKLMHSHRGMTVASQPYPVLYFMLKEEFLRQAKLERRYALDHLFGEADYTLADVTQFFDRYRLSHEDVSQLFDRLESYKKGLWTREILDCREHIEPGTFLDVCDQLLEAVSKIFPNADAQYVGSKEVLIEEYIPYLLDHGYRVVLSVRDPRAMIASLNFGQRDNKTGADRPILFSLRAWRKSVAFLLAHEDHENFCWLRYEDLVTNPKETMRRVTSRLGLEALPETVFCGGLRDQYGVPWGGNSSFGDITSIGTSSLTRYRETLPDSVRSYIETVCAPEMACIGYFREMALGPQAETIRSFKDPFSDIHPAFPENYSHSAHRVEAEIERLNWLEGEGSNLSDAQQRQWFIHTRVWSKLRAPALTT